MSTTLAVVSETDVSEDTLELPQEPTVQTPSPTFFAGDLKVACYELQPHEIKPLELPEIGGPAYSTTNSTKWFRVVSSSHPAYMKDDLLSTAGHVSITTVKGLTERNLSVFDGKDVVMAVRGVAR